MRSDDRKHLEGWSPRGGNEEAAPATSPPSQHEDKWEVILGPPLGKYSLWGGGRMGGLEVTSSVCLGHFLIRLCGPRRLGG